MSAAIPIRAALLREPNTPLEVADLLLDPPGEGEVRVRVAAAGVCHSDVHIADAHLGTKRWPIVLGHEGAGIVEEVGGGVTTLAPGDHVAFTFIPACGACRYCRSGALELCEPSATASYLGTMMDGTRRLHAPRRQRGAARSDGRLLRHARRRAGGGRDPHPARAAALAGGAGRLRRRDGLRSRAQRGRRAHRRPGLRDRLRGRGPAGARGRAHRRRRPDHRCRPRSREARAGARRTEPRTPSPPARTRWPRCGG